MNTLLTYSQIEIDGKHDAFKSFHVNTLWYYEDVMSDQRMERD